MDKYKKLVEDNQIEEVIKNPLETKTKNICNKYALEYLNLKNNLGINVNDDGYLMDIEEDNNFIFHEQAFFYGL